MRRMTKTKWLAGGALTVALIGTGTGFALPPLSAQDDKPLTGANLDRAVAAALASTGGGTVTGTEAGDDGAAFGVEIRFKDGRQVEVNLDKDFKVVGRETDDDGPNDDDGAKNS